MRHALLRTEPPRTASGHRRGAVTLQAATAILFTVVLLVGVVETALALAFTVSAESVADRAAALGSDGLPAPEVEDRAKRGAPFSSRIDVIEARCYADATALAENSPTACDGDEMLRVWHVRGTWTWITPVAATFYGSRKLEVGTWSVSVRP